MDEKIPEKVIKNGDIVEAQSYEFQLYKNGNPTGHYMRGEVVDVQTNICLVKSFHNGHIFEIKKSVLKIV